MQKVSDIRIYCDGSYSPHSRVCIWSFVVTDKSEVIHKHVGTLRANSDSKEAESLALISAAKYARLAGYKDVTVFTDLSCLASAINGKKSDMSERQKTFIKRFTLESAGLNLNVLWTPRENDYIRMADAMCTRTRKMIQRGQFNGSGVN